MDFMSKRFFVLLLALGAGAWNAPAMGKDAESASRSPAPAAREGAEFTRLPVSWTVTKGHRVNRSIWMLFL